MRPLIDSDLQTPLRVEAAHQGVSVSTYVNRIVKAAVAADREKRETVADAGAAGSGAAAPEAPQPERN